MVSDARSSRCRERKKATGSVPLRMRHQYGRVSEGSLSRALLVSGAKDNLIQIYDSKNDLQEIQIIEEHTAAVNSVKFIRESDTTISLLSGGADS